MAENGSKAAIGLVGLAVMGQVRIPLTRYPPRLCTPCPSKYMII